MRSHAAEYPGAYRNAIVLRLLAERDRLEAEVARLRGERDAAAEALRKRNACGCPDCRFIAEQRIAQLDATTREGTR